MKRIIIESPYAGDITRNTDYARRCVADSLRRGEAPFASHLLYTQPGILRDTDTTERERGILAGFTWHIVADLVAVYGDYGVSSGMVKGIENAKALGIPIEYRLINENNKNQ